jgi:hypothetical protein
MAALSSSIEPCYQPYLKADDVTLLAACRLVPERLPAFHAAIASWALAARAPDEARPFARVVLVDW